MTEEARDEIRQWLRERLIEEHKRLAQFHEEMDRKHVFCGIIGFRATNNEGKTEDVVYPVSLDEVPLLTSCYENVVAHRINEMKQRLDEF